MKACPICGSTFSGDEMFCPHDGARLIVHDQPAQLVGEQLHHLVDLKRLVFKDAFGERYIGEMTSSHVEVKVTVFNQAFTPPEGRLEALVSTKMLLDSPLPPQVATAFSWSVDDDPSYLIESNPMGPSLRLLIEERGHLDWRTALKIVCSLARNLDWMDGQGVVHRAIQPESIYVTDIQRGYTHLSEWAIGVLAYQANPLEALSQGQLVIAPGYTAPELVGGKASADRRSMIYTLGILLYEMLTGKAPFSAPGSEEILKRIKRERPVKLSMAYPEGDLPPGLDDLFEVMTAKQPDKRFQSLQAVTNALSTLLDDGTSASDFPDPVRAKEEPDIHKKNGKTPKEVDDTTSKKTMLFISSDELQSKISEASEAVEAKAPASTPEKKSEKKAPEPAANKEEVEIDEAGKATIQMDRSVLEQDQKEKKKATTSDNAEETPEQTPEATPSKDAQTDATPATTPDTTSASEAEADSEEEDDSDAQEDDAESTGSRKKKRKKKRRRTDLMHEAANVATALKDAEKADAEKAAEKDATSSDKEEESNGVQVDDPSPTGNFTSKIEEAKGGTTKIIIDEEFARDAKSADTPSIVVDESLTAEANEPEQKSKGISGSSVTKTDERPGAKDKAEEKDDEAESSKKSRKSKKKSRSSDKDDSSNAKAEEKADEKAEAKTEEKADAKDDAKADDKAKADAKKSDAPEDASRDKADDKDKKAAAEAKEKEDDKKSSSKKRRKPARDAQEETARLPAAKTETVPGEESDKKDDKKDAKATSSSKERDAKKNEDAGASADASSDGLDFLPQLTNDANLDEHWFSTDTEAAWDREVLMEHTARTEDKVNKVFITAIVVFLVVALGFIIYVVFIYDDENAEGEASLERPAIELQLAALTDALHERIG